MRKVAARIDTHAENRIPGLEDREEDALISLAPGMRLYIRELTAEKLLDAIDSKFLGHVDNVATAVITPPWIAFRILIGENRPRCFEDRARHVVFRGDQLNFIALPNEFAGDDAGDLGVYLVQGRGKELILSGRQIVCGVKFCCDRGHQASNRSNCLWRAV